MFDKSHLVLNLELKAKTCFKSITEILTVQTRDKDSRALEAAELENLYLLKVARMCSGDIV